MEMKGHQAKIGALAFSLKDGNLLLLASADKTAKLWDINQVERASETSGGHAGCGCLLERQSRRGQACYRIERQ